MGDANEYRVLGSIRARRNGTEVSLGGSRPRSLLAILALNAGRPVSIDRLGELIWDGHPPESANALQRHIWQLRRVLGADAVRTEPSGYLLHAAAGEVDALRFERLAADARAALAAGEPGTAAAAATEALALWHGPALAGASDAIRRDFAPSLEEARLGTLETRIDAELALGRADGLLEELRALAVEHPLRERMIAQLMTALRDCERQREALECFDAYRRRLAEDTGLDPGDAVRELHESILRGDRAAPKAAAQLPADIGDFTGRAALVRRLTEALSGTTRTMPLLGIAGQGGMGKTTLAVHVAHQVRARYPDGQLFVPLRGVGEDVREPLDALGAMLTALGVGQIPLGLDERSTLLRSTLDGRRVLLVLDNASDAAQLLPLLPGSAGCAVLVTSRRTLTEIPGLRQVELSAMDHNEARRLFATLTGPERAEADADGTEEVLRRCAGMPLAIRVAGGRLASRAAWSVADLAARLSGELSEFSLGALSVRDCFELSYASLDTAQARAFRLLALWPRIEIDLPTAAALLHAERRDAERVLEELVDLHLLGTPRRGRYLLHDLLHDFATEQLRALEPKDERAAAIERVADFINATRRAIRRLTMPSSASGRDVTPGTQTLTFDSPAAGAEWSAENEPGNQLFVEHAARFGEAPPLALAMACYVLLPGPDWDRQRRLLNLRLDLARRSGSVRQQAAALANLANGLRIQCRPEEAERRYLESIRLLTELGETYERLLITSDYTDSLVEVGRYADADVLLREALGVARRLGEDTALGIMQSSSGMVLALLGDPEAGLLENGKAFEIGARSDSTMVKVQMLGERAHILLLAGRATDALQYIAECRPVAGELPHDGWVGPLDWLAALAHRQLGEYDVAREHAQRALRAAARQYLVRDELAAGATLARILTEAGCPQEATRQWENTRSLAKRYGLAVPADIGRPTPAA